MQVQASRIRKITCDTTSTWIRGGVTSVSSGVSISMSTSITIMSKLYLTLAFIGFYSSIVTLQKTDVYSDIANSDI